MKPVTREWLKAANDDIIAMQLMLGREEITNLVAFHAQQTIEKSFKAVVEEYNLGNIKTHNLESLFSKIASLISGFDETILSELDTIYIEARYPGDLGLMPQGKPSSDEAKAYYLEAFDVRERIESFLNQIK
jgi:HEPN domain-containing protein